ncbi:hypothetical protein C8A01DRAFT_17364 [Parachaetomium inaequale]|uniref:Uncharacterized protein n=1 Tax=Parachaetomium inaequale TaxID=2588326 RepID=A0AAN6PEP9_9PEZI|nr:hypothetical protein C8A01DRAFT_17364 [Parachaetomium inaequale]
MPATEIITIINNSGKVISTGKQLVNIFKEAQAAYRDRRDAVKAERRGIQRAKTFDVTPRGDPYYDDYHYGGHPDEIDYAYDHRPPHDGFGRRRSYDDDDGRSYASSRYSRHSRRSHRPRSPERQLALTEGNLKTHSEVSATSPSKAYRSPYAETAPRDMQLSRPTLAIGPPPPPSESAAPSRHQLVHRPRSDTALTKKTSIDMNLAYGDIPPDLASRVDLDPVDKHAAPSEPEDPQETQALTLMDRIEDYLEKAHCVHHTASSMIENLQRNPEAAAAVALSLAELSTLIGKMSPAFLGLLKGGSPAVFALLASPQFLIGAGVAVGVTVVMFGGWKIVKRLKDSATATKTLVAPLEMRALPVAPAAPTVAPERALPPVPAADASAASYDEALVLRDVEELSTIETWRRGIVACGGDDESADVELMSRAAERALKDKYNRDFDEVEPCDSVSQVSRARSDRSRRSSRSHRSSGSQRHRERDGETKVSERKSSAGKKNRDGGESEAASERSHRSHRSHRSSRGHEGSAVSRSSKHSSRITLKAIEEGDGGGDSGSAAGKPKEKKRDMIKQLFKMKKDKEDRERAVSVLV